MSKNTPDPSPDLTSAAAASETGAPAAGRLVLVVGPSGVGKDTLLEGARAALIGDQSVVFPRRVITRPAELGGEDYVSVDGAAFATMAAAGAFALSWTAHDLAYGVPAEIDQDLAAGRTVVVNVSRQVLDAARQRYPRVTVVSITADPARLADRLRRRGRESEAEIAARLARASAIEVQGDDVVPLQNDGTPEEGAAQLLAAIKADPTPEGR